MYKIAELKTWQEAAKRMIDGEVFYYQDAELSCDTLGDSEVNFVVSSSGSSELITGLWEDVKSWKVKMSWEDALDENEPVLCWVSKFDEEARSRAFVITHIDYSSGKRYLSAGGSRWKYARPVNPDECLKES